MKSLPALPPAAALAALALALAAPADAQRQGGEAARQKDAEMAKLLCEADPTRAALAVHNRYNLMPGLDTAEIVGQLESAPPELTFIVRYADYGRSKQRLETTDLMISQHAALASSIQRLNESRDYERQVQNALKRSGPAPFAACPCFDSMGEQLKQQKAALEVQNNLLKRTYEENQKEACAALKASTFKPPEKPVSAAAAVATRVSGPDLSKFGGFSINDGQITTVGTAGYSGSYTWSDPPMTVGPDGFSMEVSVTANADDGQRFSTGISVKSGFGIERADAFLSNKAEIDVLAQNGRPQTKTVTLKITPPTNIVKGEKYYLVIGAFYGPHATYTFIAK